MIKNYTTKVDVYTSIGGIQAALARSGASKIMIEYDTGKAVAISFCINTATGLRGFTLPAPAEGTLRVFKKQGIIFYIWISNCILYLKSLQMIANFL